MRIGTQLRGFVQDAHHVIQIERLLLHHRRDHHARRSAADGAGQLMAHAEKAMGTSVKDGGDRVTFYSSKDHAGATTGWMIYKA